MGGYSSLEFAIDCQPGDRVSEMKSAFLVLLLIGVVVSEELASGCDASSKDSDLMQADYHRCTHVQMRVIVNRILRMRNHCLRRTRIHNARCRRRIHHMTRRLATWRRILRSTYRQIVVYKKRYRYCMRTCYSSCNRIMNGIKRSWRGDQLAPVAKSAAVEDQKAADQVKPAAAAAVKA